MSLAQMVKYLPAMREIWVQALGWEDPLEKGNGYPLQYSGLCVLSHLNRFAKIVKTQDLK